MKAYQVFKGEQDKHGRQRYDLVATYLDKDRALEHCKKIAEATPLYNDDVLEEGEWYGDGKYKNWNINDPTPFGWSSVTIARFEENHITE